MMMLKNGSRPLMWSQGLGGGGSRNYIGTVLAEWDKFHPFVVWRMASDDGKRWDTFEGTYVLCNYRRSKKCISTKSKRSLNV